MIKKFFSKNNPIIRPATLEAKFVLTSIVLLSSTLFLVNFNVRFIFLHTYKRILFSEMKDLTISSAASLTDFFILQQVKGIDVHSYIESAIKKIQEIHTDRIACIKIYDKDKSLLASTLIDDYASKPAFLIANPDPEGVSVLAEPSTWITIAAPVYTASKIWGYLTISYKLDQIYALMKVTNQWILMISGIILLAGVIFSSFFARQLAKPIKKLSSAVSKIDSNTFETDLRIDRTDELGILQQRFRDLIDRLRLEEEEKRRVRLKMVQTEKLATIGYFTAGIAHEMNNPITGALACIEMLRKKCTDCSNASKYLNAMENSLKHAGLAVRELLYFSRETNYTFKKVFLCEIINCSLDIVRHKLEKSGAQVIIETYQKNIEGFWDAIALERAFANLIGNAIDAVPADNGRIFIFIDSIDDKVFIKIKDNGNGISADKVDKVFEPFYTTKDPSNGTGLGLTLCQKIIIDHHGTISIESTNDKGTIISLTLPREVFVKYEAVSS